MKIVLAALAAFVVMGTTAAPAATIEGLPTIVDGDTVKVNGIPVRLKGVDAPEMGDRYGPEAARGMQAVVGSWLRCELTGEKTHNREVGYCVNGKGEDIGEAIIKQGFALACPRYSDRYVKFEQRDTIARLPRATYCLQGTGKLAVARPQRRYHQDRHGHQGNASSKATSIARAFASITCQLRWLIS